MTKHTGFHWYASADAEVYTIKEDSRDAVIAAATAQQMGKDVDDDGKPALFFYIVEASKFDLRIADFAVASSAEDLFAEIEEEAVAWDFANPDGGTEIFHCSDTARQDLLKRLKAACEQWQADHNLSWSSWSFAISRNEETIVIPLEEPAGDA